MMTMVPGIVLALLTAVVAGGAGFGLARFWGRKGWSGKMLVLAAVAVAALLFPVTGQVMAGMMEVNAPVESGRAFMRRIIGMLLFVQTLLPTYVLVAGGFGIGCYIGWGQESEG